MGRSILFFFLMPLFCFSQADKLAESKAFQEELNEHYANPDTSILLPDDLKDFAGLPFFPLDEKYIVEARLIRTPDEKPFEMPTTTDRRPLYVKFAEAHFTLENKDFKLDVFQPVGDASSYLFIPFTDLTSGVDSYGGGRYLDFEGSETDVMVIDSETDILIIDFNKAYNPYCAYNPKYSCPIPPEQNDLPIRVEAGVGFEN